MPEHFMEERRLCGVGRAEFVRDKVGFPSPEERRRRAGRALRALSLIERANGLWRFCHGAEHDDLRGIAPASEDRFDFAPDGLRREDYACCMASWSSCAPA